MTRIHLPARISVAMRRVCRHVCSKPSRVEPFMLNHVKHACVSLAYQCIKRRNLGNSRARVSLIHLQLCIHACTGRVLLPDARPTIGSRGKLRFTARDMFGPVLPNCECCSDTLYCCLPIFRRSIDTPPLQPHGCFSKAAINW